jgi:Arc/MetJ-type ribon-helix-helix transcriptional regulator
MSIQIAVRIPSALIEDLDSVVASGRFETRADAVRAALEALLETERRAEIGRRIVEGYRRVPQEDTEVATASESAATSLEEEPW